MGWGKIADDLILVDDKTVRRKAGLPKVHESRRPPPRAYAEGALGRGERPASGRAELRALKEGRAWPNADSGGTGTDPLVRREGSVKAP